MKKSVNQRLNELDKKEKVIAKKLNKIAPKVAIVKKAVTTPVVKAKVVVDKKATTVKKPEIVKLTIKKKAGVPFTKEQINDINTILTDFKTEKPVVKTTMFVKPKVQKQSIKKPVSVKPLTVDTYIHEKNGMKIISKEQAMVLDKSREAARKAFVAKPEGPDPRGAFNPRGVTLVEARKAMNSIVEADTRLGIALPNIPGLVRGNNENIEPAVLAAGRGLRRNGDR